jgi:hypothetical protein
VSSILERGAAFLDRHARLLERRGFERTFRDGRADDVASAVAAYRNPDGGFGHALEADLRVSSSQPVFVHFGLSCLRDAGVTSLGEAHATCDWLASVADERGAVPYALPDALDHPRAGHWNGDFALAPSLHATAGVTAGLHALGVSHPWLENATRWCLERIRGTPPYSGHRILNALDLLEHVPDAPDRDALLESVKGRLFEADYVQMETGVEGYGLTPLRFAPTPDAPLRDLFDDAVIEAHLDQLVDRQEEDGGWPIAWDPPEGAARAEWRGTWTLDALRTLRAYGRL